jgi:hypothetical protein
MANTPSHKHRIEAHMEPATIILVTIVITAAMVNLYVSVKIAQSLAEIKRK